MRRKTHSSSSPWTSSRSKGRLGEERPSMFVGSPVRNRGENIMLQNQRIMLCSDAHNLCQLCSTKSYYAPEIYYYASKQINFLGHKNTFSHRTVTKHIERLHNSRIEAKCHRLVTLVVLQNQRCLNVVLEHTILMLQPGSLRSAIFSYRVTWKLRMRIMYGLQNNRIMPS